MVVVWNQWGPEARARILAAVPGTSVVDVPARPSEAPQPNADVFFVGPIWSPAFDVQWAAPVPWVHIGSTGVDTYPADLLRDRRYVTCGRGAVAAFVAEFAVAAMLSAVKCMPSVWHRDVPPAELQIGTLSAATVGIVGYGAIGRHVARMVAPLARDVIATRRRDSKGCEDGVTLTDLDTVLREADHLVIAVPATTATRHLIGADAFSKMKSGAHLVNVARGSVVDHGALLRALDDGRVSLASLDVTEPEPLPPDSPLATHPRVRISPHVSYRSGLPEPAVDVFVDNLQRFVDGRPLRNVVDLDVGY